MTTTPEKQAVIDTITEHLRANGTNAISNAAIWQAVWIALDAYEENVASGFRRGEHEWVILFLTRPLVICSTRARARRRLKTMLRLSGQPRSNYTIVQVDREVLP